MMLQIEAQPYSIETQENEEVSQDLPMMEYGSPYFIGSDPECDLIFRNDDISRKHIRIDIIDQDGSPTSFVTSTGLTGVTYLNGVVLQFRSKHELMNGDRIYLGKVDRVVVTLKFLHDEGSYPSFSNFQLQTPHKEIDFDAKTGEVLLRGWTLDKWQAIGQGNIRPLEPSEYKILRTLFYNQTVRFKSGKIGDLIGDKEPTYTGPDDYQELMDERKRFKRKISQRILTLRGKIERYKGNPMLIKYDRAEDAYYMAKIIEMN